MSAPKEYPQTTMPSKYGEVRLALTDPTHACIAGQVEVNTVEIKFTLHLGCYEGGWDLCREYYGSDEPRRFHTNHALSANKIHARSYLDMTPSDSAKKKITEEMLARFREWVAANPRAVRLADFYVTDRELTELEDEKRRLEDKAASIGLKILALRSRWQNLERDCQ